MRARSQPLRPTLCNRDNQLISKSFSFFGPVSVNNVVFFAKFVGLAELNLNEHRYQTASGGESIRSQVERREDYS